MAYIGSSPTKVVSRQSANIFTYTATANQTAFTGADANGNTLACSPSDIMVHMNGIKLEESDFTATTTTVTLVSGAAAGDEVTITAFLTFESADHYTKSAADTRYVNATGDTMTGALAVDAGNGDQLTLDDDGERFTQISLKNNGSQYAAVWYDNSINVLVNHAASGKGYVVQTGGSTDRLVIDSSGRVTKPHQPAFSTRGTNYTQGNTWTTVKPATTELNVGSHYNSSTGVWTVPVAGNYLVVANGLAYPTGTGGSGVIYNTAWYKNGYQWEDMQDGEYYTNHSSFCNGAIIPCGVNDTLDFRFYRASGSVAAYTGQFVMYGYLLG